MTFTTMARALVPTALIAAAPAMAAAPSPDLARLKAHLTAVQTMTANFTQTDDKGRVDSGTLQMKRPGRIRFGPACQSSWWYCSAVLRRTASPAWP